MNIRFTIIILIFLSGFSFGQRYSKDFDKQLQEQDNTINALKNEIAKTRQDIQKQQNKERNKAK